MHKNCVFFGHDVKDVHNICAIFGHECVYMHKDCVLFAHDGVSLCFVSGGEVAHECVGCCVVLVLLVGYSLDVGNALGYAGELVGCCGEFVDACSDRCNECYLVDYA